MKKLLVYMLVCVLLLTGCASATTTPSSQGTTDTPTPSFPAIGEWADNLPYSFINDQFALVIDIQQANSTANVASITSIVGQCAIGYIDQNGNTVRVSQPYISASSASVSINGSDITISANVAYFNTGIKIVDNMQFIGTINADGSLSLASSQLGGVQDYTFTSTTGAVAHLKSQFEQGTCN